IIPKTDTPGAREVGSHLFVMKMLDDCYETGVQQKFITGMDMLEEAANKKFGNSFVRCTGVQKKQMLQSIEKKENFSTEVYDFYTIMKDRTIEGYMTSKYVVMDIMKAELIPSIPYNGYHLIKNNKS
ncbi:MAG: gluconate 2-dehydrogenase subunit 3 family protein, partial [Chitinophagaceae bacterium]